MDKVICRLSVITLCLFCFINIFMEELFLDLKDLNIQSAEEDTLLDNVTTDNVDTEKVKDTEAEQATDTDGAEIEEEERTTGNGAPLPDKSSSHQNSTLSVLVNYLKDEGALYLDKDTEDIETLEQLKELIQESNKNARFANLNESQKRYQEALAEGIPKNEFEGLEKEIQALENIKDSDIESNEQLRMELAALDLISKGIPQEKALKLAKVSLEDPSNIEDTKAIRNSLVDSRKTKFKDLVTSTRETKELGINDLKKAIFDKESFLGTPLNDNTKKSLFDLMTVQVGADDNNTPLNEFQKWQKEKPLEASLFINYMYLMTNKGKDMGLIKKNSVSQSSKELEKRLKTLSFDANGALQIPDEMVGDNGITKSNSLTINI